MASVNYFTTEQSRTIAVISQVMADRIALRFCGEGTQPGEKFAPELKGFKVQVGPERSFKLSELMELADWTDYSVFGFPVTENFEVMDPINLYRESLSTKSIKSWMRQERMEVPLRMFVPHRKVNFMEMEYGASLKTNGKVISNLKTIVLKDNSFKKLQAGFFPRLKIEAKGKLNSNDVMSIDVKAVRGDGSPFKEDLTCYLECTGGYLAKQRIDLKSGKGSTQFQALLLSSGDQVKIKAGFKFYSGADEHFIEIV